MYAPPTSLVLVMTSEMESERELKTKSSPPSGLRASCTGPRPTSMQGFKTIGLGRVCWVRAGAGQGDDHDLVAAGAGYKGLGGVGQDDGVRGAGAALEDGADDCAGGGIDEADGVAAAVGDDQGLAVGGDAGGDGLFAGADLGNLAAGLEVDDGDGVGAGVGHVGQLAGGVEIDGDGLAVDGDGGGDGVVLSVDDGDGALAALRRRS